MEKYIGVRWEDNAVVEVREFETHLDRYNWLAGDFHLRASYEHLGKESLSEVHNFKKGSEQ